MELTVTLIEPHKRAELFGVGDANLRQIREALGVQIQARINTVRVLGEPASVARAAAVIEKLQERLRGREYLPPEVVADTLDALARENDSAPKGILSVFARDAQITPRTDGQHHYVQAMLDNDLSICLGPAGTGKTYLAAAVAVHLLKAGKTKRIALVRPAVEAGEKLGFLPGDLLAKVNPYLRPLFDAMHDMMSFEQLKRFMVNDVIEVVPLAFMRGRTLNHSVVILDEAQNTTPSQMLMFLTRMGHHSKMIVTGDDTQVDLEEGQPSGLSDAVDRLSGCPEIAILRLSRSDIVRHRLVQEVVLRYSERPAERGGDRRPRPLRVSSPDSPESPPPDDPESNPQ